MKLGNIVPSGEARSGMLDIVAGYILAEVICYAWYYAANKLDTSGTLNTQPFAWVNYNMIASVVTPLVIALIVKGRMRKVMLYAFWFAFALNVHMYLYNSGTVKLP